jgi:hypothetical protein
MILHTSSIKICIESNEKRSLKLALMLRVGMRFQQ